VTKAPRKSPADWIGKVLSGPEDARAAAGERIVDEPSDPVRRATGRNRQDQPTDPMQGDSR
jgi:hypothetical protein